MQNIKNLIFDFDGVILDSVEIKNKAFLDITYCQLLKAHYYFSLLKVLHHALQTLHS